MSNNQYTSPRLYASRYKPKHKNKRTFFEMGMGYIESYELGMSRKEFQKLYAHWEQKLKQSEFFDIEYRSPSHTGHFTPFFRQNGSTATFQSLYDPAKQEYYEWATEFDTWMSERTWFKCGVTHKRRYLTRWSWVFEQDADVYKTLWYLHIEGIPYRAVAKAFSGLKSKWLVNVKPVPPRLVQPRSVFWAHTHTHRILDLFWKWVKDTKGLEDPRG